MRVGTGLLVTAALGVASPAMAINMTPTNSATALAGTLFLNLGGLTILDASLQSAGGAQQAATWMNPQGTYGLPAAGIAFSTGNVDDYATGFNDDPEGLSTGFEVEATPDQEDLLRPISGVDSHFDVVQLDIDFFASFGDAPDSPGIDTAVVNFFAAFGSEEFPDFVGSQFVDGFGLYVNGQNVAAAAGAPININHPDFVADEDLFSPAPNTELNGVLAPGGNPVLRFEVPINLGQTNEFSIILGDASDDGLDTTVYLSSFFADPGGNPGNPQIPGGETEFDPILPSNPPDPETGAFIIEIPDIQADQMVWIDPPVSVGYTYETNDGSEFDMIIAPSLATVADVDGYMVSAGGMTSMLAAGATFDFLAEFGFTPTMFTISGIDPTLMLDPSNPLAFPLAVSFTQATFSTTVTITPIVEDLTPVPLPAGAALYLGGLGLFGATIWRGRRRRG